MRRVLIAGMGNILRGDDGFGIHVARKLAAMSLPEGVEVYEAGSAGVALVHKLMDGFDDCILIDAAVRRDAPGTLYTLTPIVSEETREFGTHDLEPSKILALARAVGALPARVVLIARNFQPETLSLSLDACSFG